MRNEGHYLYISPESRLKNSKSELERPKPESDARTQLTTGEPTPLSVVPELPHAALWHGCVPTHTLEITR